MAGGSIGELTSLKKQRFKILHIGWYMPSPVKVIWYVDSTDFVSVVIRPITVILASHLKWHECFYLNCLLSCLCAHEMIVDL